jgi:PAS domain S-box-containing protein
MLLRTKIAAGYTTAVLLMAVISVSATIWGYDRIIQTYREIEYKYHRITSIAQELAYRTSESQAGIRGFIMTGKTRYLVAYDENVLPMRNLMKEAREIHKGSQKYLDLINDYERILRQWEEGVAEPQKVMRALLDSGAISQEKYGESLAEIEKNGRPILLRLKAITNRLVESAASDMRYESSLAESVARYSKVFLIAVALAGIVAISITGVILSKHITMSLYSVVKAARRITKGDLGQRIPVPAAKDELRELAYWFNHMVQSLQDNMSALRESENKYAALVENAADGIAIVQDEKYVVVNPSMEVITGYSADRLVGMDFRSIMAPSSAIIAEQNQRDRLKGKEAPAIYEVEICHRSGELRCYETNVRLISYLQRPAVIVVLRDVTERRDYQRNLKRLSEKIIETQEEERKRIAQELHDEIGQALSVISIHMARLDGEEDFTRESALQKIGWVRQLVEKSLDDIHRISYNLRPYLLDDFGLLSAVRWHTEMFEKNTHIQVRTNLDEGIPLLPKTAEILIYRIIQEALTNVLKHSGASEVRVSLADSNHGIELSIVDNGMGFDEGRILNGPGSGNSGLGIFGMRERVAAFNGQLLVQSRPGEGTGIFVHVPHEA